VCARAKLKEGEKGTLKKQIRSQRKKVPWIEDPFGLGKRVKSGPQNCRAKKGGVERRAVKEKKKQEIPTLGGKRGKEKRKGG